MDWLAEALVELSELSTEADEEGVARPAGMVVAAAERVLRLAYAVTPAPCLVDMMPEGVVSVQFKGGRACSSVLFLCEPVGTMLCSVNMNGIHRRKRYSAAGVGVLPDDFMRAALVELAGGPPPSAG